MTPLQRNIALSNIKIKIKTNDNNKEHPISNERTNDWSSVSEVPKVNGSCVVQTRKGILSGFLEVERKCLNLCQEKGGRREGETAAAASTRIASALQCTERGITKTNQRRRRKAASLPQGRDGGGGANDHHHFRPTDRERVIRWRKRSRAADAAKTAHRA